MDRILLNTLISASVGLSSIVSAFAQSATPTPSSSPISTLCIGVTGKNSSSNRVTLAPKDGQCPPRSRAVQFVSPKGLESALDSFVAGQAGAPPAQAPAGAKGDVGPSGPQGPIGPQGQQGTTGAKGERGETGASGPAGAPGLKGKDATDRFQIKSACSQRQAQAFAVTGDIAPLGYQLITLEGVCNKGEVLSVPPSWRFYITSGPCTQGPVPNCPENAKAPLAARTAFSLVDNTYQSGEVVGSDAATYLFPASVRMTGIVDRTKLAALGGKGATDWGVFRMSYSCCIPQALP